MLLTQYSKHLILMSQYSVPNLISDLQSKKNKRQKRPEKLDEGISHFLLAENRSMFTFNMRICQAGKEITKQIFIFHP